MTKTGKKAGEFIQGSVFSLFLILVFTFRFFVEYVKEDQVAFEAGMKLNMGQWLSIPFVLIGVALLIYSIRKHRLEKEKG